MASIHMYSPRKTSHISNVPFIVVSFFSSISVMVHGQPLAPYHIFVCLRYLSINRLRFAPWCHTDWPSPKNLYLSETSNNPGLTELTLLAKINTQINTCDSMGGSMPTVGMITVELVLVYIARGVLLSPSVKVKTVRC